MPIYRMSILKCLLWSNPVPLGWGDHIRWQHETDADEKTTGHRHALARREASRMRHAMWNRLNPPHVWY